MKRDRLVHAAVDPRLGTRLDDFHRRREEKLGERQSLSSSIRRLLEMGLDKAEKRGGKPPKED